MSPSIIDFDELRRVSRLGPRATLATVSRWAERNGIKYRFDGRGGIWTTVDALNAALGLKDASVADHATYSVDMVA